MAPPMTSFTMIALVLAASSYICYMFVCSSFLHRVLATLMAGGWVVGLFNHIEYSYISPILTGLVFFALMAFSSEMEGGVDYDHRVRVMSPLFYRLLLALGVLTLVGAYITDYDRYLIIVLPVAVMVVSTVLWLVVKFSWASDTPDEGTALVKDSSDRVILYRRSFLLSTLFCCSTLILLLHL